MRKRQIKMYIIVVSVLMSLNGCNSASAPTNQSTCLESKIFFGLTINDQLISEIEWKKFLDSEIVTRFPAGFTIVNSDGFWKYSDTCETSSEPSKILILVYPGSKRNENKELIKEIAEKYKQTFQQQFVLTSTIDTYCNLE